MDEMNGECAMCGAPGMVCLNLAWYCPDHIVDGFSLAARGMAVEAGLPEHVISDVEATAVLFAADYFRDEMNWTADAAEIRKQQRLWSVGRATKAARRLRWVSGCGTVVCSGCAAWILLRHGPAVLGLADAAAVLLNVYTFRSTGERLKWLGE